MSDVSDEKIFYGLTPVATLYYTAHVNALDMAPPMGLWRSLTEVSAQGAEYAREFAAGNPVNSLDYLRPQHFADVDRVRLDSFARSKDTTLKQTGNPFGTQGWLEFQVPALKWHTLPPDMPLGSWTIQTDGLHVLASLKLPAQLSPDLLQTLAFPGVMIYAIHKDLSEWNLTGIQLALGWDWHCLPGHPPIQDNFIYQLPDTELSQGAHSIQTYVGTDIRDNLPKVLVNNLILRFITHNLSIRLNRTGFLHIAPVELPEDIANSVHRTEHQNKLLDSWRKISEMQRTLDDVEDLLMAGRAWVTALDHLRERGYQSKSTEPHSGFETVYGPFKATMETLSRTGMVIKPSKKISLRDNDLPTESLNRAVRNVDNYRHRLIQQAAMVKEGIDVQSSLMSARSAEESMQATFKGLDVSKRGVQIALLSIAIAVITLILTVDWNKLWALVAPPTQSTQSSAVADPDFGVTYRQQRTSLFKP